MRIGIATVSEAQRMGGIGTYIRELLPNLILQAPQHEFYLFRNINYPLPIPKAPNIFDITFNFNINNSSSRRIYEQIIFPSKIKGYELNLLHSIDNVIPFLYKGIQIVTIHDVTLFNTPGRFTLLKTAYLKYFVKWTVKRADHIITVSNSTKNDLHKHLNAREEKITVIYESANPTPPISNVDITKSYGIRKPYFVFVGTIEPGKNLERMMKAFIEAKREMNLPHQFIIIGGKGWKTDSIFQTAASLNANDSIVFTGYVPLDVLSLLLKESSTLLFASLNEGFGLPIIEAFKAGVPVLTSNISAMPEVAGDAALLVDPNDVDSIKEGIIRLATDADLRKDLIAKGRIRYQAFSWSRCAEETLKVYEAFSPRGKR